MTLPPGNHTAVVREVRVETVRRKDGRLVEVVKTVLDVDVHDDVCVLVDATIAVMPTSDESDR